MIAIIKERLLRLLSKEVSTNLDVPEDFSGRQANHVNRHLEFLLGIYQHPEPINNFSKVPERCLKCSYFFSKHQGEFLYCAVNPSGGEDCQDFYQRKV
jgi:hypothetical protein